MEGKSCYSSAASKLEFLGNIQYLQLMSAYAPAWGFGGPIRLMFDYAQWMAGLSFRSSVITGDVTHDYNRFDLREENVNGVYIKRQQVYWRGLVRNNINLVMPCMALAAASLVFKSRYKVVVHICELRGLVPLYALLVKLLFRNKVVLVHSAFGMLHNKKSWRRKIYDWIFLGSMLRSIDLALAQNNHERDCYHDLFSHYDATEKKCIELFPLHIAHRDVATLGQSSLRTKYGVPEEALVFIFLGRLHPEKGIERAIDVFLDFSKHYAGRTYFLIVGRDDGIQQEICKYISESGASSSIRIVNDVYEHRFEYYALADLFVGFPTIHEETMLASVEALSCGTPIIVSREADIPFVEEEGAGFVIDFSMKSAIGKIQEIAAMRLKFRERALAVANQHFSEVSSRSHFNKLLASRTSLIGAIKP